jgi:hypothetical protein
MPVDPGPSETGPPDEVTALIEVLVAQALDDVEAGRLSVEQALRTIATVTWMRGYATYVTRDD